MAQIYVGHVQGGVVVLDEPVSLPEGRRVEVHMLEDEAVVNGTVDSMAPTRAWLISLAKKAEALAPDLPTDLAENHDHYAHGKPRT